MSMMHSSSRRSALTLCSTLAIMLCAASAARAQDLRPYEVKGDNYSVKMKRVIAYAAPDNKTVFSVKYSYSFGGRDTVHIRGVGVVPAKGEYSYLTFDKEILFKESQNGPVLATVPVTETLIPMAPLAVELPKRSDFPSSFRDGQWLGQGSFQENMSRVFDKYFRSGHDASDDNGINYWESTFFNLTSGVPPTMRCKVAVLISHPYNSGTGGYSFRVQFRAYEKLSHDDWGDMTDATRGAVETFITGLIEELKTGVRR